jgi:hypothetical protein
MLDVASAATVLHRSPDHVRRLISSGQLVATRTGKRGPLLVPRVELLRLVIMHKTNRASPASPPETTQPRGEVRS